MATIGTVNEAGESVDLYAPRKCHVTNSLIASNDYSSVQVAIANVDTTGVWDGTTTIFCVAGFVRSQARSDHAINHLAIKKGIIRIKSAKPKKMKKSMKKKVQRQPAAAPQKGRPAPSQKKGQAPVSQKDAKPQVGKKTQVRKTRA